MCPVRNVSMYCVSSARIFCCEKMTDLSFGKTTLLRLLSTVMDWIALHGIV